MLRRGSLAAAALAIAATGAASQVEAAAPRTSSLNWTRLPGAESCIASRDLARAVEKRLGRSVFVSPADAELTVEGRVERSGRGFRANLAVTKGDGTVVGRRELRVASGTCANLDESLVLVLALMIDPDAASDPKAPPAPIPPPPPETKTIIIEVPVPAPPPSWSFDVAAQASVLVAGTGGILPGARLTASVLPPGFLRLELDGNVTAAALPEGGAPSLRFVYGGLALCPTAFGTEGALRVDVCVGAAAGVVRASTASSPDRDDAIVAGTGRARLAVPLLRFPSWSLDARLELGLLAFLRRPSYTVAELDPVALDVRDRTLFRLPVLGGTGSFGLGIEIP